ncbi:MAG: DUF1579 family protein [Planctomycetes bacterium]|nr:DUF1579 family protein [Planctomycetota bacterium]
MSDTPRPSFAERLAASQAEGGMHHQFSKMVGKWAGQAKTYFEPNVCGDDSPIEGEFRIEIGGHFLFHEYSGPHCGQTMHGLEIIGHNLDLGGLQMSWVNNCHTMSQIMQFEGEMPSLPNPFGLSNTFKHNPDHPEWGWRVVYDLKSPDQLSIQHFIIPPAGEGDECLAIDIDYRRQA